MEANLCLLARQEDGMVKILFQCGNWMSAFSWDACFRKKIVLFFSILWFEQDMYETLRG